MWMADVFLFQANSHQSYCYSPCPSKVTSLYLIYNFMYVKRVHNKIMGKKKKVSNSNKQIYDYLVNKQPRIP